MYSRLRSPWRNFRICEWHSSVFWLLWFSLTCKDLSWSILRLFSFNKHPLIYFPTFSNPLRCFHSLSGFYFSRFAFVTFPLSAFLFCLLSDCFLNSCYFVSFLCTCSSRTVAHKHSLHLFPSSQVSGDGANGCQPMPGDPYGPRPREDVLPAIPDPLWNQAPALCWHNPQGKCKQ